MRRATFAVAAIGVAVVLQTALLDRLPFPGGAGPDLVLVLVVALAVTGGPLEGALAGFGAGLALDIAPPASGLLGLSALVFCLVGYGCGRLRGPLERSAWLPLAVVMLGVAAGEVLYALVGLTFGDPDITWQSIRLVLPVAVVYDILLCPFVLYAVVRFGGYGAWAGAREPDLAGRELAGAGLLGGLAAASAVAAGTAVRDTRGGREPRLRASAARQADGWIGGHQSGPGQAAGPRLRRRPLQLRARDGVAGSAAGGGPARAGPGGPAARPVQLRLAGQRRGDGVLGGSLRSLVSGSLGYSAGLPGSAGLPRASSRLSARVFRGGGGPAGQAGGGSSRGPLRPAPSRLRARALRGGSSALAEAGRGKPGRPARLRLRARRGDGVLGGGVLGGGTAGTGMRGRGLPGSAFTARRSPAAPGPLRSGHGAAPRFRGSGRGLSGWWERVRPGRRRSLPGGSFGAGRRGGPPGGRRGYGVSRRRRLAVWRVGSKRTGGTP